MGSTGEAGGERKGRTQPPWRQPVSENGQGSGLRLLNSLTREKELFVTSGGGPALDWYVCGPTVYDAAHVGHARSYICFDILRRVLRDYFGYNIRYVMNITDIDDKIIARARKAHLYAAYKRRGPTPAQIIADAFAAAEKLAVKADKEENEDKAKLFQRQLQTLRASLDALKKAPDDSGAQEKVLEDGREALGDWLDEKEGAAVVQTDIFTELPRRFENEFHEDMGALGVEPPDVLTRVSEYVPEIVRFVEGIIERGFAYEAGGSVYFDTEAFDKDPKHFYCKLLPESYNNNAAALKEGEGELSTPGQGEKRSGNDFALWKASKAGEPRWPSPWGEGRPGWHIECSAMASEICGPKLDIHSGGNDLRFPHHDNEIAQSEAAFDHDQWANYWLHAGTLRIEGCKMSKSLKNFITIREALQTYTARQLRILFLLHGWCEPLDYSMKTLSAAIAFEKTCGEFFQLVKHILRSSFDKRRSDAYVKFSLVELELSEKFVSFQADFHAALCDNIDTKKALEALRNLISASNVYITAKEEAKAAPNALLLRNIAKFVTRSLRVFGAIQSDDEIGFPAEDGAGKAGGNQEEILMPYLQALVAFREEIRAEALKDPKAHKEILSACDALRNKTLPGLGCRLEDKESGTVIKLVSAEELRREAEQRAELEARKAAEKAAKEAERRAKEAKARIQPGQLFRQEMEKGKAKYSAFDEEGVPTHNAAGEEIGKGLRKKLLKQHEAHAKKFAEVMAKDAAKNGH